MDISYKGGNSVIIATKKTSLFIDPKVSDSGLKDPSVSDGIELLTDDSHILDGAKLVINSPGEYEVGDFSIRGVATRLSVNSSDARPTGTAYRVETPEFRIAVLGNIEGKLSDDQLEEIGVVDILILPVGGNGFTLDPHDAATLARKIDPKVVIPIRYEDGAAYEVPALPLDSFTAELNLPVETLDRYKVKNAGALPEVLTVVALKRA